jgi:uncharacterized delta-60 repeat protein
MLSNGLRSKDVALVRYRTDGSLDAGFGHGGKVLTAFGSGDSFASALLLQLDGKLVVGGDSYTGSKRLVFTLIRYNPNGSLDASFGHG